jgi:hypothetical protein
LILPIPANAKQMNILIARILLAKPTISSGELRRLVPGLKHMPDAVVGQKLAYLRTRVPNSHFVE